MRQGTFAPIAIGWMVCEVLSQKFFGLLRGKR